MVTQLMLQQAQPSIFNRISWLRIHAEQKMVIFGFALLHRVRASYTMTRQSFLVPSLVLRDINLQQSSNCKFLGESIGVDVCGEGTDADPVAIAQNAVT